MKTKFQDGILGGVEILQEVEVIAIPGIVEVMTRLVILETVIVMVLLLVEIEIQLQKESIHLECREVV